VRAWCDEQHLLLILDEVQTGVGRCGTLWGHQLFGVEPDIMTVAKGLGGGIPIGAVLAKEHASAFEPGDHGSTFGGNPLSCAAAIAVFRAVLEQDLPARAERTGAYFRQRLETLRARWPAIREVRGRGLLIAMEFDREVSAALLDASLSNPARALEMINMFSRSTLAAPPSSLGPGTWVFGSSLALGRRVLASNPKVNVMHRGFKACDSYANGEAAMAAIACPVLFLLGAQDQMTQPKAAQLLIRVARDSGKQVQVAELPVGHHQMNETPDATLFAIRDFLKT